MINAARCWRAFTPEARTVVYERNLGPLIPTIVEFEVSTACRARQIPFTLGGDHSLSYHALKSIVSHYGPVNVVHFDAHHDAYTQVQVNHFTLFYHLQRRLPVKIYPVGHRYQVAGGSSKLRETVKGNTYVSLDVDYFDPALVGSVGHAVPCSAEQGSCDLKALEDSLDKISGPIVGLDLVEWMGAPENSEEYRFVRRVFSLLDSKCDAAGIL
jgi:arginase